VAGKHSFLDFDLVPQNLLNADLYRFLCIIRLSYHWML
jgi:hypothetical protein